MTREQSGVPLGQGLWDLIMYFSLPQDTDEVITRFCTNAHQFLQENSSRIISFKKESA